MNKDVNENKAFESDVNRFKQLVEYKTPKQSLRQPLREYTFITAPQVNEEGEDEQQPQQGNSQEQGMQQQIPQQQSQVGGGIASNDGGQQQMDTQQDEQGVDMNNQQPQIQEPQPMVDPMQMQGQQTDGGDEIEDVDMETDTEQSDDEVIDVDELTQSQEAAEYKIDGVDDRLSKLFNVVTKLSDQLDQNAKNIMDLKDEFEKRNPTEEEKINLRSDLGKPYTESPKNYWDKKVATSNNYNIMNNNEVSPSDEQEEFNIKKSDIEGINMKDISDTLNFKQNLNDYLGF